MSARPKHSSARFHIINYKREGENLRATKEKGTIRKCIKTITAVAVVTVAGCSTAACSIYGTALATPAIPVIRATLVTPAISTAITTTTHTMRLSTV